MIVPKKSAQENEGAAVVAERPTNAGLHRHAENGASNARTCVYDATQ